MQCEHIQTLFFIVFTSWYLFNTVQYCDASKWRRYYRRSTGHCSVLPLGTSAVVLATARYYRHGPGLPPLALVLAEYYRLGSTAPCLPLRNRG